MTKEEDICYICYDINNKDSIKLKCKHNFHYDCIMNSFMKESKTCPYCRQIHGYLPLKKDMEPVYKVHKEYGKKGYTPFSCGPKKCKGILKSGYPCTFNAKPKSNYCGKHQKQN